MGGPSVKAIDGLGIVFEDNISAAQARSGGSKRLAPCGFDDEVVEGLADDRGWGATLRGCPDLGLPRIICVFDPAISITAGQPVGHRPDVKSIPFTTIENRSDNDTHLSTSTDDAP
jgi:hypothetical protein